MAVGDARVFPGFLSPVLKQLFFPKPPTTFLKRFCRGERRKYAGKKSRLNRGSKSQPPSHESDMLTTEPPGRETKYVHILYQYWICTARVESRKRKPKAEKNKGSFQNYQRRLCAPMNGVCKTKISLAGLESRGRKRKEFVVSF